MLNNVKVWKIEFGVHSGVHFFLTAPYFPLSYLIMKYSESQYRRVFSGVISDRVEK